MDHIFNNNQALLALPEDIQEQLASIFKQAKIMSFIRTNIEISILLNELNKLTLKLQLDEQHAQARALTDLMLQRTDFDKSVENSNILITEADEKNISKILESMKSLEQERSFNTEYQELSASESQAREIEREQRITTLTKKLRPIYLKVTIIQYMSKTKHIKLTEDVIESIMNKLFTEAEIATHHTPGKLNLYFSEKMLDYASKILYIVPNDIETMMEMARDMLTDEQERDPTAFKYLVEEMYEQIAKQSLKGAARFPDEGYGSLAEPDTDFPSDSEAEALSKLQVGDHTQSSNEK